MALYIGTSGWSYAEWQPAFYPPGLPSSRFLHHYATVMSACEVNATHYRMPSADTVARWAEAVPREFRFAVKAHRRLTDRATMAWGPAETDFLTRFIEALAPLGDRLGVVLLQFADEHGRDDEALDRILRSLPAHPSFAIELRHEEWRDDTVTERIAEAGVARCVGETEGLVPDGLPAGHLAYVRLRADHYADAARAGWKALLEREAGRRNIFAIARHAGLPADDPNAGLGFARWLAGSPPSG